jgi:hypothetical protein
VGNRGFPRPALPKERKGFTGGNIKRNPTDSLKNPGSTAKSDTQVSDSEKRAREAHKPEPLRIKIFWKGSPKNLLSKRHIIQKRDTLLPSREI